MHIEYHMSSISLSGKNILKSDKTLDLNLIRESKHFKYLINQAVEGFITGMHKSPYHGFSVEFAEHKLYNPGESTRFVDWKVYARTDKLFTKQFEEETNLRAKILIDNSSSMHFPIENHGKFVFSSFLAACLCNIFLKQRDAFGVSFFSDKIEFESPLKSTTSNYQFILQELEKRIKEKNSESHTSIIPTLHQIAETTHKRSLVVIFTDLFSSSESLKDIILALQHLKYYKNEVVLFHVSDHKTEVNLDLENRPYKFIDVETKESIKLYPHQIQEKYSNQMKDYIKEAKVLCGQSKIEFIEADISAPVNETLYPFLVKKSKLF